jgi:superfamily I DNA/RNA helicase
VGTYARSKGLEFETVVLPSVSEGVVPSVTLDDPDTYFRKGAELYVAMARARDRLVISYVGEPSYLLADLIADGPGTVPEQPD